MASEKKFKFFLIFFYKQQVYVIGFIPLHVTWIYHGCWVSYMLHDQFPVTPHNQSHGVPCSHSAPFPYPSTPSSPLKKERMEKKERRKREGKRERERKGKNLNKGKTNLKKKVYGIPGPPSLPSTATGPSTPFPPPSTTSTSGMFAHHFDLSSTCQCNLYTLCLNSSVPYFTPAECASIAHSANL